MQPSERTESVASRERHCSSSSHTPLTSPRPVPLQFFFSFETRQAFTNFMSTNQKSLLLLSYCTCYTLIWITCVKIEKKKTNQTKKNYKNIWKHNVMSKKKFKTCKKRQKDAYEKKEI